MSNTESVRQVSVNAAPIHSSSISKLRSIGGGRPSLTLSDGDATNWLDAFSEIFARMASSDAAPKETEIAQGPEIQESDSAVAQTDSRQSESEDNAADQTEAVESSGEEQVSLVLPVVEVEVVEAKPIDAENLEDSLGLQIDLETDDPVEFVPVDAKLVAVSESQPQVIEHESPVVVVETFLADQNRDRSRGQQEPSTVVADSFDSRDQVDAPDSTQLSESETIGPHLETGEVVKPLMESESTSQDSDRQSRRRRHERQHEVTNPSSAQNASNHAAANRSGGVPIPSELSASNETLTQSATQTAETTAGKPSVSNGASVATIQAVAKLAATATNSARTAVTAPSSLTNHVQPAGRSTEGVSDTVTNKPAASKTDSSASEAVNRAKLIQRVSKAFQHLGPDGGHVRLRLAPAELGTVRLDMRLHDRHIQARVVAESEAAASVLREHLPELRQRLESQGIQIDRFDIEVETGDGEPQSSWNDDSGTQQRDQNDRSGYRQTGSPRSPKTVSPSVSRADVHRVNLGAHDMTRPNSGGVDVRF